MHTVKSHTLHPQPKYTSQSATYILCAMSVDQQSISSLCRSISIMQMRFVNCLCECVCVCRQWGAARFSLTILWPSQGNIYMWDGI